MIQTLKTRTMSQSRKKNTCKYKHVVLPSSSSRRRVKRGGGLNANTKMLRRQSLRKCKQRRTRQYGGMKKVYIPIINKPEGGFYALKKGAGIVPIFKKRYFVIYKYFKNISIRYYEVLADNINCQQKGIIYIDKTKPPTVTFQDDGKARINIPSISGRIYELMDVKKDFLVSIILHLYNSRQSHRLSHKELSELIIFFLYEINIIEKENKNIQKLNATRTDNNSDSMKKKEYIKSAKESISESIINCNQIMLNILN